MVLSLPLSVSVVFVAAPFGLDSPFPPTLVSPLPLVHDPDFALTLRALADDLDPASSPVVLTTRRGYCQGAQAQSECRRNPPETSHGTSSIRSIRH
jgi:hypothetical protein